MLVDMMKNGRPIIPSDPLFLTETQTRKKAEAMFSPYFKFLFLGNQSVFDFTTPNRGTQKLKNESPCLFPTIRVYLCLKKDSLLRCFFARIFFWQQIYGLDILI